MPESGERGFGDGLRMRALFGLYRSQGDCVWVEAAGTSMKPLISPGDLLLVDFSAVEVEIGEIALFPLGERIAAHRVVRRERTAEGDVLTTRGDANDYGDPALNLAGMLGVVQALRRGPDGTPETVMCRGGRAVALARASAAVGALNGLARRVPPPFRRPAAKLARVGGSFCFGLIARLIMVSARIVPAAPLSVTASELRPSRSADST